MSLLPRPNGRLFRRLNALVASLKSVWAFNADRDKNCASVGMLFENDFAAAAFEAALMRIKRDIELARDGGLVWRDLSER